MKPENKKTLRLENIDAYVDYEIIQGRLPKYIRMEVFLRDHKTKKKDEYSRIVINLSESALLEVLDAYRKTTKTNN